MKLASGVTADGILLPRSSHTQPFFPLGVGKAPFGFDLALIPLCITTLTPPRFLHVLPSKIDISQLCFQFSNISEPWMRRSPGQLSAEFSVSMDLVM